MRGVDDPFGVPAQHLCRRALGDLSGEHHALSLLVDVQDGADDVGVVTEPGAHGEGEQERGGGQARRALAEVVLVERERRLAVELEEHAALRPGDEALRTEWSPTAARPVADLDGGPVQADRSDVTGRWPPVDQHPGAHESVAVRCEAPGDRHRAAGPEGQALRQSTAVDLQAVAQHEDPSEVVTSFEQAPAEGSPDVPGARLAHRLRLQREPRAREARDRHRHRSVVHAGVEDRARRRATRHHRVRERVQHLGQGGGVVPQVRLAEDQDEGARPVPVRQRRRPPVGRVPSSRPLIHFGYRPHGWRFPRVAPTRQRTGPSTSYPSIDTSGRDLKVAAGATSSGRVQPQAAPASSCPESHQCEHSCPEQSQPLRRLAPSVRRPRTTPARDADRPAAMCRPAAGRRGSSSIASAMRGSGGAPSSSEACRKYSAALSTV